MTFAGFFVFPSKCNFQNVFYRHFFIIMQQLYDFFHFLIDRSIEKKYNKHQ